MRRLHLLFPALGLAGLVGAISCGDAATTEPVHHHALAAVYDLRTTLDTFSFETSAPSPPDCPGFTLYCTHYRAFSGASLNGILTLADSADGTQLLFSAAIQGAFCDAWDLVAGCTHVAPKALHPLSTFYVSGGQAYVPKNASDPSAVAYVSIMAPDPSGLGERISLRYQVTEDSLFGRIYWSLTGGRSPPAHYGRFVAVRRR